MSIKGVGAGDLNPIMAQEEAAPAPEVIEEIQQAIAAACGLPQSLAPVALECMPFFEHLLEGEKPNAISDPPSAFVDNSPQTKKAPSDHEDIGAGKPPRGNTVSGPQTKKAPSDHEDIGAGKPGRPAKPSKPAKPTVSAQTKKAPSDHEDIGDKRPTVAGPQTRKAPSDHEDVGDKTPPHATGPQTRKFPSDHEDVGDVKKRG